MFVYFYLCLCISTCVRVFLFVFVYFYLCLCISICVCVFLLVFVYFYLCLCISTCVRVFLLVFVYCTFGPPYLPLKNIKPHDLHDSSLYFLKKSV